MSSGSPVTFCGLPFEHLCVGPEGTARICCMTNDMVTDQGAPMSLNVNTAEEIWNSAYMRKMRQAMTSGQPVSACQVCYDSERATGQSYRTGAGSQLRGSDTAAGIREISERVAASGYRMEYAPEFIKLELGNLCNLKCRMCYGAASSQIERDNVHSRWSGGVEPLHAVWRGDSALVGPEPKIGVRRSGMVQRPWPDGNKAWWTDGHAMLHIPLKAGAQLDRLTVKFHSGVTTPTRFRIVVNGRSLYIGVLPPDGATVEVDLRKLSGKTSLALEIISDPIGPIDGRYSLPLEQVVLHRQAEFHPNRGFHPEVLQPRGEGIGPWYMHDDIVFAQILKRPEKVRRFYVTGGEPLINERFLEILQYLIDCGAARHIELEISSNCTRINDRILGLFEKFERMKFCLSLDGVGDTYEYIRFPARWDNVQRNIARLRSNPRFEFVATPVLQAYNIMTITDLFRFCHAHNLDYVLSNLLRSPVHLQLEVMPRRVRQEAARRLFEYLEKDADPDFRDPPLALANYLHTLDTPPDFERLRQFMLFTNDLDATRDQSFRTTFPDVIELLRQDGFDWTDELRFATGDTSRVAARDRVYAWL